MDERVPSWPDLLHLMSSSSAPSLGGVLHERSPEHDLELLFSYRPPGDWRIAGAAGPAEITGAGATVLFTDQGAVAYRADTVVTSGHTLKGLVHPRGLGFGPRELTDRPRAQVVAGREAWTVHLTATEERPQLETAIDRAYGIVLSMRGAPRVANCATFESGASSQTTHSLTQVLSFVDERTKLHGDVDEVSEALGYQIPVPRYWPDGMRAFVFEGDPETRAVLLGLDAGRRELRSARLGVAPLGIEPPSSFEGALERVWTYRWEEGGLAFRLMVMGDPLDDGELELVKQSMR